LNQRQLLVAFKRKLELILLIYPFGFVCTLSPGQVPGVIFFTVYWRNDLVGLYTGMAVGYILCTVLYSFITLTSDWKKYSDQAIERSEAKED